MTANTKALKDCYNFESQEDWDKGSRERKLDKQAMTLWIGLEWYTPNLSEKKVEELDQTILMAKDNDEKRSR